MHDRRWWAVALVLGFWLVETIYSVIQMHYRWGLSEHPVTWESAIRMELVWTSIGLALTPGVIWMAHRFPISRSTWRRDLVVHAAAAAVFATTIRIYWDYFGATRRAKYFYEFTWNELLRCISMGMDAGVAIYSGIVLAVIAIEYHRRYQASLVEGAQLQTQLVQAQLQALRMQIDPHFLFNTLHTVSELVHEDPDAAEKTIARLSDLLRRSIEGSGNQETPLEEEIEFVKMYLEIEKARFEDRLSATVSIAPETRRALVPTLILQPLVENSIRHGISKRPGGGRVEVRSSSEGGELYIEVRDDGVGFGPKSNGAEVREGVGLSSVRGRLERLYGEQQELKLESDPQGVSVRIRIPLRAAEEAVEREAHAAH